MYEGTEGEPRAPSSQAKKGICETKSFFVSTRSKKARMDISFREDVYFILLINDSNNEKFNIYNT